MARSKTPKREDRKAPRRVLIADDHVDGGRTLQSILVDAHLVKPLDLAKLLENIDTP